MIEFCTKKRMALASVLLIVVSVGVLLLENNYSLGHDLMGVTKAPENKSDGCWEHYPVHVQKKCSSCNYFEMRASETFPYCQETGYRECVECQMPNGTSLAVCKSCPRESWVEERQFWTFESLVGIAGLLSYGIVHMRQKRLDRLLLEKVSKQIASGV